MENNREKVHDKNKKEKEGKKKLYSIFLRYEFFVFFSFIGI